MNSDDIIFHISIRPRDNAIVRNHFQYGRWGMEERYGPCHVRKNKPFEIVILAEHEFYKIAVNGHHLGVFRHRLPLNLVNYIGVKGELTVDHVLLEQDAVSAQQQASLSHVVNQITLPAQPLYQAPVVVHHLPPVVVNHQPGVVVNHQPPPYYTTVRSSE
jgi:hypothetical protein